jgi:hypothetical protein
MRLKKEDYFIDLLEITDKTTLEDVEKFMLSFDDKLFWEYKEKLWPRLAVANNDGKNIIYLAHPNYGSWEKEGIGQFYVILLPGTYFVREPDKANIYNAMYNRYDKMPKEFNPIN